MIALAAAVLASQVHVGEELHVDSLPASAVARGAATSWHVERELRGSHPALLGPPGSREKQPDIVEDAHVGGRHRAGGAVGQRLVDQDDVAQVLAAAHLRAGGPR